MAVVVFIYGTFSNTHNTLEVGFKTPRMYNAVRFTDARDAPALKKKKHAPVYHLCLQRNTAWTSSAGVTWYPNMEFATTSSTDSSAASPVLPARGHRPAVECTRFPFLFRDTLLDL